MAFQVSLRLRSCRRALIGDHLKSRHSVLHSVCALHRDEVIGGGLADLWSFWPSGSGGQSVRFSSGWVRLSVRQCRVAHGSVLFGLAPGPSLGGGGASLQRPCRQTKRQVQGHANSPHHRPGGTSSTWWSSSFLLWCLCVRVCPVIVPSTVVMSRPPTRSARSPFHPAPGICIARGLDDVPISAVRG